MSRALYHVDTMLNRGNASSVKLPLEGASVEVRMMDVVRVTRQATQDVSSICSLLDDITPRRTYNLYKLFCLLYLLCCFHLPWTNTILLFTKTIETFTPLKESIIVLFIGKNLNQA